MKKFLLMVFLVILFVIEVNAIDFKLVSGINISKCEMGFKTADNMVVDFYSYGVGFLIGGGIEFTLSENLSIELDSLYFQKSSVFEEFIINTEELQYPSYILHEVSFPVLIKFKHLFNSPFFLLGGGEFAFGGGLGWGIFNYGAVFGVGIEIKKIISSMEMRYHIGY
ncbi:MAG: hypothetical protein ACE5K4_11050, partial [Candidatus Hydrothermarchaeota archaeon]